MLYFYSELHMIEHVVAKKVVENMRSLRGYLKSNDCKSKEIFEASYNQKNFS